MRRLKSLSHLSWAQLLIQSLNFICHEFPCLAILCILLQRLYRGVEFRAIHLGYKFFDFYQQISIGGVDC
jgi:hypothetical protein